MSDRETIIREWLDKAQGDYISAKILIESDDPAAYDSVCFLSQQCIEKTLKAALIFKGMRPAKTHDLVSLGQMYSECFPASAIDSEQLDILTVYAVEVRYTGYRATRQDAHDSYEVCLTLRDRLLQSFQKH